MPFVRLAPVALYVACACMRGARFCQVVCRTLLADLVFFLAAVNDRRPLIDRVPTLNLIAEHVNVVVERLERRLRARVRELDRPVDRLDRLAVELLDAGVVDQTLLLEPLPVSGNWILLPPFRDLFLAAVDLR